MWSELLPQFLTNGHETWHIDWSWREDVQDIFWGCMGNFVAMVAAYLSQKFKKKYCAWNYFLSFSPVVIKRGTHIGLHNKMCKTSFQGMRDCVAMVTTYLL